MNKKYIEIVIILIFIGLMIVSIAENHNQLGESKDSSSDSAIYDVIDNYFNVKNYHYKTKTSTKSAQKNLCLKDLNFSFCDNLDNQYIFTDGYCPQGICITEDFILITSYTTKDAYLGACVVFERETGDYLITLGMDKDSHLGGIAYDGKNVWVCNSSNRTIERISYDFIYQMATRNKGKIIDATALVDCYSINNIPSCITHYNGRIWIATHNPWINSHMVAYYYDQNEDQVVMLSTYEIPPRVQGIEFGEEGEVYVSTSYGRRTSSYLLKYKSIFTMTKNRKEPLLMLEMPPCSEEIAINEEVMYILFESAGEKYRKGTDGLGKSVSPLNQILLIPLEELKN